MLWGGDGAARLVDAEAVLGALLLERLEPGTSLERHPDRDEAIAIACAREPWLRIDPKPLAGEPAFDRGHFLRNLLPSEIDRPSVGRLVDRLAGELRLDAESIRRWAFVRSVENALWGLGIGGTDVRWDLECARHLAVIR